MTASLYTPGGLPLPDLDDPPNVPADLLALAGELDLRVENRFNTTGDRDATLPPGTTPIGTRCLVTTTGRRYIVWPTTGGNLWHELTAGRITVANDAALNALMLVPDGAEVLHTGTGVIWGRQAGYWFPTTLGTAIRGKLWRTQGFSGALANNTEYVITMGAARVSGGFATVLDGLLIPYDGLYDLDWQGYVSGGVVGIANFWVRRTHPGVADNILGAGILNKTYAGVDSQGSFVNKNVPLRAGNTLRLVIYQYAGPLTFYGITELSGCFLTATYTGPLNGALPV